MAMARKRIPAAVEDLVQIVGGDVRVSEYFLPGTKELGQAAVKALEGRNAVILANHGCLGAGPDLNETFKIVCVVEKAAKATIFAQILGGAVELEEDDIDFMRDFYLNKYGTTLKVWRQECAGPSCILGKRREKRLQTKHPRV